MKLNPEHSINQKNTELHQFILAVVKGGFPCAAVLGPPGCGKSSLVRKILEELKVECISLAQHNSPFGFFRAISENPDSTIVIDDSLLSRHPVINTILKAATGLSVNGIRQIEVNTSDSVLKRENLKSRICLFSGKIIFIANPEDLVSGKLSGAMSSRTLIFNYDLTFEEKKYLINKFSENPEHYGLDKIQMTDLISHLNQHLTPACSAFDLRLFEKAVSIVKTSDSNWKFGVNRLLEIDPMYTKLTQVIAICDDLEQPKSKRPELFAKVTGLSRSTYYDLCRKFGINKSNDKFTIEQDDYYRSALVDLVSQSPTKTKKSKKVQNSSQIQEHTDKEVDMMSNGVQ